MNTTSKIINLHTSAAEGDVAAALCLLKDALADDQKRMNNEGAAAMQRGDYETATSVIDFAKRLLNFEGKVEALVAEWETLEKLRDTSTPAVQQIVGKKFFGRRSGGEITPQDAFYHPILEILVELGGSGRTKDILNLVGEKMKDVLTPKDYEPHESDGKQIRWRNTAQWARNEMANVDGRMIKGSPNGVWEISEKGRLWLEEHGIPRDEQTNTTSRSGQESDPGSTARQLRAAGWSEAAIRRQRNRTLEALKTEKIFDKLKSGRLRISGPPKPDLEMPAQASGQSNQSFQQAIEATKKARARRQRPSRRDPIQPDQH